jgi:capsular exopolysaccharide synthesis family protein
MDEVRDHQDGKRSAETQVAIAKASASVTQATQDVSATSPYATSSRREGSELAVTIRQYLYMAVKRRWLISSITLVFLVLGGVQTFLVTPLYRATVRIQIEREPVKIVESGTTTPVELGNSDFLRTQYELIKSRALAERVVSSLHLAEDDNILKTRDISLLQLLTGIFRPKLQNGSLAALQGRVAGILVQGITVTPVAGSRLVDLSYIDTSPSRAQSIANGYADAYIAANLDKRFEANAYAKSFLDDQIKQLKLRLEESEKAMLNFAEREKMVEVSDKASNAENNLAAANVASGQLIAERIKNEQLWRQVENTAAINLPQLLSNPVIELLRGQRKALETEYQEKLETLKPGFTSMIQISSKVREIDKQLAAEVKAIKNSLKAAYETTLGQENQMRSRIEELRSEVLELQKKGIQYNILKREAETNRGIYNSLLQRYKEVDIAGGVGTNNIFVVDRAMLPGAPAELNIPRSLLLSLVIGLSAGVGFALFLELLDDRVRAPEEIEELSGLATLGIIPRMDSDEEMLSALSDPRSSLAEAYRSLATALQFSTHSGLPRSIAVTSAGPAEGKSTTALSIARYFAQMGLKVLLVDADLRKPSLHQTLQLNSSIGLSNYLIGAKQPPEVVQKTENPNLVFMASGPLPPNAADILNGPRLFSLVSLGTEVFDVIIFDSPPLLGLADAQLLASAVAATVFVVGAGEKGKGMIRSALRRLQLARITLIGTVLTKFDPKAVGYTYGYG